MKDSLTFLKEETYSQSYAKLQEFKNKCEYVDPETFQSCIKLLRLFEIKLGIYDEKTKKEMKQRNEMSYEQCLAKFKKLGKNGDIAERVKLLSECVKNCPKRAKKRKHLKQLKKMCNEVKSPTSTLFDYYVSAKFHSYLECDLDGAIKINSRNKNVVDEIEKEIWDHYETFEKMGISSAIHLIKIYAFFCKPKKAIKYGTQHLNRLLKTRGCNNDDEHLSRCYGLLSYAYNTVGDAKMANKMKKELARYDQVRARNLESVKHQNFGWMKMEVTDQPEQLKKCSMPSCGNVEKKKREFKRCDRCRGMNR